jgi:hypothetical protein
LYFIEGKRMWWYICSIHNITLLLR